MVCIRKSTPDEKCRICGKKCGCYIHYREKFRPKKEPRYIKYMTDYMLWSQDLKIYNDHRKKVHCAKCRIDANPPSLHLPMFLQRRRLREDAQRQLYIDQENKKILKTIIEIDRKGGAIDSFNPCANLHLSRWRKYRNEWRAIEKVNEVLLQKICFTRSNYPKKEHDAYWKYYQEALKLCSKFPFTINKKPDLDKALKAQPSIVGSFYGMPAVRQECYLEFQVENGECLGKIIVQLYHDFAPVTVQNFMALMRGFGEYSYKNCPVHRIVKNRFLETGDVTKGNGTGGYSIYGESFDEEKHVLKHTKAGVLSMVRLGGEQKNNSRFCITFMGMQEWDKKNVVFGKIIHGIQVLKKISDYGRFIGKPLKKIFISDCGRVPNCTCQEKFRNIACA